MKTITINFDLLYPRYFLIDREGIVVKEYSGFSKQIEQDIEEMVKG